MLPTVMKMLAKEEERYESKEVPLSQLKEIRQAINFLTECLATSQAERPFCPKC